MSGQSTSLRCFNEPQRNNAASSSWGDEQSRAGLNRYITNARWIRTRPWDFAQGLFSLLHPERGGYSERGTFGDDVNREATNGLNHKGERMDASPRDGTPRSSDEVRESGWSEGGV